MLKKFWIFVAIVITLIALWTAFTLTWSYSAGERAGYVHKFSKKGWICKTWEGEMAMVTMPGTVAEKFYFTVRKDGVYACAHRSRVSLPSALDGCQEIRRGATLDTTARTICTGFLQVLRAFSIMAHRIIRLRKGGGTVHERTD